MELLNLLGAQREPFFFAINFDVSKVIILKANEFNDKLAFNINGVTSLFCPELKKLPNITSMQPILFNEYEKRFNALQQKISSGDTYLANLSAPTKITLSDGGLLDVYARAKAPFKLWVKNHFTSFSPERFIKITGNIIQTEPMKGTADKNLLEALLKSQKELAEHTMSVDLLRNDLSQIASNVRLKSFREATLINSGAKKMWQTSSKITGVLQANWQSSLGDIFAKLLPAGSISGTPKKMTVKILKDIESYDRNFFTGVFGYFGGDFLDSAVAIRFIEQIDGEFFYKSGGGITTHSECRAEYSELLSKIYLPF